MDFFSNLLFAQISGLPFNYFQLVITILGFMGALALMYSVLLEAEKRQDAVFVVAAATLFVYGWAQGDPILMFAMAGMFLVAGRELVQILRGKHHHTVDDMEKYEHYHGK